MRILAVDDEPGILDLIEDTLRAAGHDVVRASDGREALGIAASCPFDVAVVDFVIPPPDGIEVLRELRRIDPRCLRFLTSGQIDLPVALDAINRGEATRVIPKPFDPFQLVVEIDEAAASQRQLETMALRFRRREAGEEIRLLHECLAEDCFSLALQPIVRAGDGSLVAFEALLRSSHSDLGSPVEILSLAEKYGRVRAVARAVTRAVIQRLRNLPPELMMFVNMHPAELQDGRDLWRRLEELHPWAGRIVFEITERSNVSAIPGLEEKIDRIMDMGYRIAVDDLGSGYNSLSVLANLKPHYIKLDRSITRGVGHNGRKHRLVRLLTAFGRTARATVIGEGVETVEESTALRGAGVELLQGYYYGRPLGDPAHFLAGVSA